MALDPYAYIVDSAVTNEGYVNVRVNAPTPYVDFKGRRYSWIPLHRLVMSFHLGRPLRRAETVRSDNSVDNLQIWLSGHPNGIIGLSSRHPARTIPRGTRNPL